MSIVNGTTSQKAVMMTAKSSVFFLKLLVTFLDWWLLQFLKYSRRRRMGKRHCPPHLFHTVTSVLSLHLDP